MFKVSSWAFHLLVLFDLNSLKQASIICSWAFHLLVLFDLISSLKRDWLCSWAFHLLVLFDPLKSEIHSECVLEHSIYWYYLIYWLSHYHLDRVLEHSIYWYYLIKNLKPILLLSFLSIPFIGIIWSHCIDCVKFRGSWAFHLLVLFDRYS